MQYDINMYFSISIKEAITPINEVFRSRRVTKLAVAVEARQ